MGFHAEAAGSSIVVGFIGATIGTWLATTLHLTPVIALNIEGQPFPLVPAIVGAAIFAAILDRLSGRRAYG